MSKCSSVSFQGVKWLVDFNGTRIKVLPFSHLTGPFLTAISIAKANLKLSNTLRLLRLMVFTDMKWDVLY